LQVVASARRNLSEIRQLEPLKYDLAVATKTESDEPARIILVRIHT